MPKYQVTLTEVQRKILALWNQDKTGSYIAYELMMTRSAVMGQLNRLRIKGHISYKTPQRKKLVAELQELLEAVLAIRVPQTATPKPPPPELDITEMIMAAATKKVPRVKKNGLSIPLIALTRRSCRYPVSGKEPTDYLFCGDTSIDGKMYCKEHYALCYVPHSTTKKIESLHTGFRRKHGPNNS